MIRAAAARSAIFARAARSNASVRPLLAARVRYNSSQPTLTPEQAKERKARLAETDALQSDWTAPILSYETVKQKSLQPSEHAYLIDVREPDEVVSGMIPSAVNVPLSVLSGSLKLSPAKFENRFGFKKPQQGQEVVFYCRSGKRSASAADVAKRNGFTNIFNYEGSWLDWTKREGNPAS
ncbi:endoplasmic reticulum protein [Auriscalpium vulgare]|uniref:Endoplasmic reticulum protein n=1 Tax=Auriscalpium vulgare TaxID=40419 RepID=A0ACB8RWE5_9AGAM|nr:endoplasmic reticulum protein [Auriscalpium vulgare]